MTTTVEPSGIAMFLNILSLPIVIVFVAPELKVIQKQSLMLSDVDNEGPSSCTVNCYCTCNC